MIKLQIVEQDKTVAIVIKDETDQIVYLPVVDGDVWVEQTIDGKVKRLENITNPCSSTPWHKGHCPTCGGTFP
jgi:hypothetical protein